MMLRNTGYEHFADIIADIQANTSRFEKNVFNINTSSLEPSWWIFVLRDPDRVRDIMILLERLVMNIGGYYCRYSGKYKQVWKGRV